MLLKLLLWAFRVALQGWFVLQIGGPLCYFVVLKKAKKSLSFCVALELFLSIPISYLGNKKGGQNRVQNKLSCSSNSARLLGEIQTNTLKQPHHAPFSTNFWWWTIFARQNLLYNIMTCPKKSHTAKCAALFSYPF